MRIDTKARSSLGDKPLTVKSKTRKRANKLRDIASEFAEKVRKVEARQESGNLKTETADKKSEELLANFYRDSAEVMFEFDDGLPDAEFFGSEDFPVGEYEMLRSFFLNPTIPG